MAPAQRGRAAPRHPSGAARESAREPREIDEEDAACSTLALYGCLQQDGSARLLRSAAAPRLPWRAPTRGLPRLLLQDLRRRGASLRVHCDAAAVGGSLIWRRRGWVWQGTPAFRARARIVQALGARGGCGCRGWQQAGAGARGRQGWVAAWQAASGPAALRQLPPLGALMQRTIQFPGAWVWEQSVRLIVLQLHYHPSLSRPSALECLGHVGQDGLASDRLRCRCRDATCSFAEPVISMVPEMQEWRCGAALAVMRVAAETASGK